MYLKLTRQFKDINSFHLVELPFFAETDVSYFRDWIWGAHSHCIIGHCSLHLIWKLTSDRRVHLWSLFYCILGPFCYLYHPIPCPISWTSLMKCQYNVSDTMSFQERMQQSTKQPTQILTQLLQWRRSEYHWQRMVFLQMFLERYPCSNILANTIIQIEFAYWTFVMVQDMTRKWCYT